MDDGTTDFKPVINSCTDVTA